MRKTKYFFISIILLISSITCVHLIFAQSYSINTSDTDEIKKSIFQLNKNIKSFDKKSSDYSKKLNILADDLNKSIKHLNETSLNFNNSLNNLTQWLIILTILLGALIATLMYFLLRKMNRDSAPNKFDKTNLKIKEDLKSIASSPNIDLSPEVKNLAELAIEIWRGEKKIIKILPDLNENQKKGLENSIQRIKRYLVKHDIEIVDYTNQKYNEGLNLDILSIEKDSSLTEPIIKETIEPTIMCKGHIVHKAKIIVKEGV